MRPPNKDSDVDLMIVLDSGWVELFLHVDRQMYLVEATEAFGDPAHDFIVALTVMIRGAPEAAFVWYGEPGETRWRFRRVADQHHKMTVRVESCERLGRPGREIVEPLEFEVKLRLFCLCFCKQMEKLQILMTEKTYRGPRKHSFPLDAFHDFQRAVRERWG